MQSDFDYVELSASTKSIILNNTNMLIVPVKEGEAIERALKRFKKKFEKTGVVKELRSRTKYTKPSVVLREQKKKAIYKQKLQATEEA